MCPCLSLDGPSAFEPSLMIVLHESRISHQLGTILAESMQNRSLPTHLMEHSQLIRRERPDRTV